MFAVEQKTLWGSRNSYSINIVIHATYMTYVSSEKEAALGLPKLVLRLLADSNSWNVNGKPQNCEADQGRLHVNSVSITRVHHAIYTEWHWMQSLKVASLKIPNAFILSGTIVALWRWLPISGWDVLIRTPPLLRSIRPIVMIKPGALYSCSTQFWTIYWFVCNYSRIGTVQWIGIEIPMFFTNSFLQKSSLICILLKKTANCIKQSVL